MQKTKEEKVARFRELCENMADIYEAKNRNYGDSFTKLCNELGPIAGLVPLHNKLDRLTTLVKGDSCNNFESVEDTLLDLANYAMIAVTELRAERNSNVISGSSEEEILHKIITSNPNIIYREEKQ